MVEEQHSAGILNSLGNFFGDNSGSLLNKGAGLLSGLLGNKADGVNGLISNFSGIKTSSAASLLSMALPAVLGVIGKHSGGTGAGAVASLLSSQKDNIAAAVPAGLNLGSVLGNWTGAVSDVTPASTTIASHHVPATDENGNSALKILLPLLLLALLAMGAWYLFGGKGPGKEATTVAEAADTTHAKTEPAAAVATEGVRESLKVKLANGVEIEAYKGGIESQLVAFLDDKTATVDTVDKTKNWFNFDNLNFKLGKAELTDSSMVQVRNIAAILKAYPAVKMKIGGYTDASGDAAGNLKLSQQRADAVAKAIVAAGGNADQLTKAEGYGSKFAKEPATASEEARKKDRRTAVRVVAK
jgi:outer membrane protein OmpA-like peptidoglycan-associated protein